MSVTRRQILGTLLPGFVGTDLPDWVRLLLEEGLGGVCLFGENIVQPEQLRALTDAIRSANPEALIAIDEEGGDVTRLYYDRGAPFPGNAVLGRIDDEAATRAVGAAVGAELRAVGVNLDFAPDVDINSDPRNPVIGIRSFGADPELVARHAAAWTEGLQSAGVAASIKHFPGHGDTAQDSHLALPTVDVAPELLRRRELVPFAAAIAAGAMTVMTSHIVLPRFDPTQPATFSPIILQGLLRGELGFGGVIVSDALDMVGASGVIGIPAAAVRALAAGCDLLCIGTKNTALQLELIVAGIRGGIVEGELDEVRLRHANERITALVGELAAPPIPGSGPGRALIEPVPAVPAVPAELPDEAAVRSAFAIAPGVAESLKSPGWHVVKVETVANIAVGQVPWGPFAALGERMPALPVLEVVEAQWRDSLHGIPPEASVLLVGKDNARRPETVAFIEALRARQPRLVTVDMGWPGAEAGAEAGSAEIATFGASALIGAALAELLERAGVGA